MYVEGDKGTGGFITSSGVLVFGFVYVDGGCNRLFHKIQSNPNNTPTLFNSWVSWTTKKGISWKGGL